jgi:hypothetical protein
MVAVIGADALKRLSIKREYALCVSFSWVDSAGAGIKTKLSRRVLTLTRRF